MTRKFTKSIKQAAAFGFDKVGVSYEGTFTGTKVAKITDTEGTREATLISLTPDAGEGPSKGEAFGVWANAVLADLIAAVPVGSYVKITHTGTGKAKGKRSPAKMFEIAVAE